MRTNLMSRLGRASAVVAIAGLAIVAAGASAEAREWNHGGHNGWNHGWNHAWHGPYYHHWYGNYWGPRYYGAAPVYAPPAYYGYGYGNGYAYSAPSINFNIPLP